MQKLNEIKALYKNSWKLLVKPPRIRYNANDLQSHPTVTLGKMIYIPKLFQNRNNLKLKLHLFIPNKQVEYRQLRLDFVMYCHSQGSNSLEGSFLIKLCAELGFGLCLFDFAGCGFSDGDFLTLGIEESKDIREIVSFLLSEYRLNKLALWGRSMGAVSALLYLENCPLKPVFLVLDTPFYNLDKTVIRFIEGKLGLPPFLTKIVLNLVRGKVVEETGVDVFGMNIKRKAIEANVPACLIASRNDEMVAYEDFIALKNNYSGPIVLFETEKSHAEGREAVILTKAAKLMIERFINANIEEKKLFMLLSEEGRNYDLMESQRFLSLQEPVNTKTFVENSYMNSRRFSNLRNRSSKRDTSGNINRRIDRSSSRRIRNKSHVVRQNVFVDNGGTGGMFKKKSIFNSEGTKKGGEGKIKEVKKPKVFKRPPILKKSIQPTKRVSKSPIRIDLRESFRGNRPKFSFDRDN